MVLLTCSIRPLQLSTQRPRQTIHDEDVLTNHPPHLTDSFTLYLKTLLVGARVTTFNARMKMERESKINNGLLPPETAFEPVGMFSTMSRMVSTQQNSSLNNTRTGIPRITNMLAFKKLEVELDSFWASFPPQLDDAIKPLGSSSIGGVSNGRSLKSVDGLLYLAHVITALLVSFPMLDHIMARAHQCLYHMVNARSIIRLHEAHAELYMNNCPSRNQVIRAGRYITDSLHVLISTSFDVSLIYPTCLTVWLNAGRILILLYQICMERGHLEDAGRLLTEADTIGYAALSLK